MTADKETEARMNAARNRAKAVLASKRKGSKAPPRPRLLQPITDEGVDPDFSPSDKLKRDAILAQSMGLLDPLREEEEYDIAPPIDVEAKQDAERARQKAAAMAKQRADRARMARLKRSQAAVDPWVPEFIEALLGRAGQERSKRESAAGAGAAAGAAAGFVFPWGVEPLSKPDDPIEVAADVYRPEAGKHVDSTKERHVEEFGMDASEKQYDDEYSHQEPESTSDVEVDGKSYQKQVFGDGAAFYVTREGDVLRQRDVTAGPVPLREAEDTGESYAGGYTTQDEYHQDLGLPPKKKGQRLVQWRDEDTGEVHSKYVPQ